MSISRLMERAPIFSTVVLTGFFALAASAQGPIYSTLQNSDSGASVGYQSLEAAEFGGIIQPDYTNGNTITGATVQLLNFACDSTVNVECATFTGSNGYADGGNTTGYSVPLTLSLYSVNTDGSVTTPAFATSNTTANINWATGAPDTAQATFSFSTTVSSQYFIYGLSFNTQNYGTSPTGVNGPYNSLNFDLTLQAATTGTNPALVCGGGPPSLPLPSTNYCDSAYWQTADPANTSGTVNVFSQDTGWITYSQGSGMIEIDATKVGTPEPATFGLIGFSLLGLAAVRRKILRS